MVKKSKKGASKKSSKKVVDTSSHVDKKKKKAVPKAVAVKSRAGKKKAPPRNRGGRRAADVNQLIAKSALKDVFKRQGSHRVRGGALDSIPASAEQFIYDLVSVSLRSMIMGRRQTCKVEDVDVALATRGEACY